ncbi:hypothetical protein ACGFYL_34675, partial [Streptomyces fagopyri]
TASSRNSGEYLLGGATSSSFPCSGQPYWVPVRKLRGPSIPSRSSGPRRRKRSSTPSPASADGSLAQDTRIVPSARAGGMPAGR